MDKLFTIFVQLIYSILCVADLFTAYLQSIVIKCSLFTVHVRPIYYVQPIYSLFATAYAQLIYSLITIYSRHVHADPIFL